MNPTGQAKFFLPTIILISFALLTLGSAMYPWFVQIFTSERGVGTWVSSMLLCCAATSALLCGTLSRRKILWCSLGGLLLILAADERFMIHEYFKHCIVYYLFHSDASRMGIAGDIPVLVAGTIGLAVALRFIVIARFLYVRLLILGVVLCGGLSVVFDVMYVFTVSEEVLKIISELICLVWLMEEVRFVLIHSGQTECPPKVWKIKGIIE
jgi:hypothetical protein